MGFARGYVAKDLSLALDYRPTKLSCCDLEFPTSIGTVDMSLLENLVPDSDKKVFDFFDPTFIPCIFSVYSVVNKIILFFSYFHFLHFLSLVGM